MLIGGAVMLVGVLSPSSRRAWVEIFPQSQRQRQPRVALLAEGVGRNSFTGDQNSVEIRRPPRGGRG